jgi:glycosyltransferase involved in cell wall biosynthesis
MKIYYRLSNKNASASKIKLNHASKEYCLQNAITVFGKDSITVIGDNLNDNTKKMVESFDLRLISVNNNSGSATFRDALNLAIDENTNDTVAYLLEDDFLHTNNAAQIIEEGALAYDMYVTGYDHPDKYINSEDGGNPFIQQDGEITRVIKTKSTHWKITNSTVMTFAARVSRLKKDKELLYKFSNNRITDSFGFFSS